MTTNRKSQCIGGPHDGAEVDNTGYQEYYFPIQEEPTLTPIINPQDIPCPCRRVSVYKMDKHGNFIYAGISQIRPLTSDL